MARRRRDLAELVPADPVGEFRRLRRLLMASDPPSPLGERLRREADAVAARGGPPDVQLEELWAVVDGLGLREAADRHLGSSRRCETRGEVRGER